MAKNGNGGSGNAYSGSSAKLVKAPVKGDKPTKKAVVHKGKDLRAK